MSATTTPPSLARRAGGLVAAILGPLWVTAVRDPVREGRLRLDALSRVERQVARAGLVLLVVLLGSMLVVTAWRAGDLLAINGNYPRALAPPGVLGLTLLALFVAWTLLVWGALDAAPSIRVLVAVLFLLVMNALGDVFVPLVDGPWITEHGPGLVDVAFYVVPGALVASAVLAPVRRVRAVLDPVLRVVTVVALATYVLVPLWIHVEITRAGTDSGLPFVIDTAVYDLNGFTLPLLLVSAVVVVDLALDVSTSLAEPARRLSARWALVVLLLLIAGKLVHQVLTQLPVWVDLLQHQPGSVVRTVLSLGYVAALVLVATRAPRTDSFTAAKERIIYGGALAIAAPFLLVNLLYQAGLLWLSTFDSRSLADLAERFPVDAVSQWYPLVISVVLVAGGVAMMRRSRGGFGDELGSAVVVVAGWNVLASTFSGFQIAIAFSYPVVDVAVTLGALAAVVVAWARRRTVPATTSITLAAALVFSWLVTSRGDYISFLGGLLGLSAVVVVVVGILYGLASDSSFASDSSRRLPADARPMLWVGFLLVSVVLLHWVEVTHEDTDAGVAAIGFFRIGIPLAAWYLGRRVLGLGDAVALQPSHETTPEPTPV